MTAISMPATVSLGAGEVARRAERAVVRLLSFYVQVESECGQVIADLLSLYPRSEMVQDGGERSIPVHFRLKQYNRRGRQPVFLVQGEAGGVQFFDSAAGAAAHLDFLLTSAAIRALRGYVLIHAGSVVADGDGVLVPGPSGAGKSTLVAALSQVGFTYFSDELAVVETRTGELLPFSKPICLKEGGWQALRQFKAVSAALRARRSDGEVVTYLHAPARRSSDQPVRARYVLVPVRTRGAKASLCRCSRSMALIELARQSLNLPCHGPSGIECLARVVEGAECFTLRYEDLGAAVEVVSDLVGCSGRVARDPLDGKIAAPAPDAAQV